MKNKILFISCVLLLLGFMPKHPSQLKIIFHHKVGEKELKLFDEVYHNQFNEPFVVNKFKYYISNIILIDEQAKKYSFGTQYFLIDEADSVSKIITLATISSKIKSIQFLIGVDSIKNVSGVQTGVLDPMKGMFWTWNSGYVFAKLEGQSDSSHLPAHYFGYHIGGYKTNENAVRKIELAIPNSTSSIININVNLLQWFLSKNKIKITEAAVCHSPGNFALQVADNYSTMFSITK